MTKRKPQKDYGNKTLEGRTPGPSMASDEPAAPQSSPLPWQLGGWGEIYSAGVMPMSAPGPLPTAHLIAKIKGETDILGMSKDEARANQALIVRRVNQGEKMDEFLAKFKAFDEYLGRTNYSGSSEFHSLLIEMREAASEASK